MSPFIQGISDPHYHLGTLESGYFSFQQDKMLCDLAGVNWDEVYIVYDPLRGCFVDYLGLDHPIAMRPGEYVIYWHTAMKDADCFGLKALVGKLHQNIASTWPANPIALPVYSRHITPRSNPARSLKRSNINNSPSSLHHLYLIVTIHLTWKESTRLM